MVRRPPRTTRTAPRLPYTTRCRSTIGKSPLRERTSTLKRRRQGTDYRVDCAFATRPSADLRAIEFLRRHFLVYHVLRIKAQLHRNDGATASGSTNLLPIYRKISELIDFRFRFGEDVRSEEHTSELQSLMRIS